MRWLHLALLCVFRGPLRMLLQACFAYHPPSTACPQPGAAYHYAMFFALLGGGLLFLALLLYFTGDIEFQRAVGKVNTCMTVLLIT